MTTEVMTAEVTIIIVPRDHFYHAQSSLESLIKNTTCAYDLIYVDHSSPQEVQDFLSEASQRYGFRLLRYPTSLSPNQARNLAIKEVKTPFILFVDNDVFFTPGWLDYLVTAAKENDASIVSPTYLIGELEKGKIHIAGGKIHFEEDGGQRTYHEAHLFLNQSFTEVKDQLKPGPTDFGEFHCLLVRTETLEKVGLLDENLLSQGEHLDLCMRVKQIGGLVYYEPKSIVTYLTPKNIPAEEVPYYLLRWSDDWNRRSIEHFSEKWGLDPNDPYKTRQMNYLTLMRRRVLPKVMWPWGKILELLVYRQLPVIGGVVSSLVNILELSKIKTIR